jgi:hypothetical protein
MTIASATSRISYVGDGSTTAFAVPFLFQSNADITVMLQSSTGVQTTLVLGTGYSLSGAGVSSGGTCTFTVAPTALTGAVITIFRDPPVTQTTSYNNNDPFPAKSHENALDKVTMLEQRTRDMISRSLQLRDSDAAVDMHLPANRQNKLLGFDSANNPVAVFGPTFVGSTDIGAAIVSTKAVAAVTTFAGTVIYLIVGGATVAGDGPAATYIRGTGVGAFTDGGGISWKPIPTPGSIITTFSVAVVGDGAADDRAAIQASIDALSALGGGLLFCSPGKTYRVVLNAGVTDIGLIMKPGVTLMLNRATINMECTGSTCGIRLRDDSNVIGPGTVAVTVSASLGGSQTLYHAPFALGELVGVCTVGALGNYTNVTRWSIRNLTITGVRANGFKIAGIGSPNNGVIEDITFPDDSTSVGCINFDWGTVGTISSAPASMAANLTAFNAGTAYTTHPNNIDIRRIKIGNMSNAASTPIRLSGVHAIRIDRFQIVSCTACAVFHTAGDLGYEFTDSALQRSRHTGIVISNGTILNALAGNAISCDAYADNVAAAISGFAYTPRIPPINTTDIVFENIRSIGNISSTAARGIWALFMEGGTFRNCTMIGHGVGFHVDTSTKRIRIKDCEFQGCYNEGVLISGSVPPEEITVEGTWCYSNAVGGVFAGINVFNGLRHTITRCRLGSAGESFQDYGVLVGTGCTDVEVSFNHCIGHVAGGAAYSLGSSTSYGIVRLYTNNTINPSYVSTPFVGINIVPVEFEFVVGGQVRRFRGLRAATPPSAGTWLLGDAIDYSDPVAAGYRGTVCTAGGGLGTWHQFGLLV